MTPNRATFEVLSIGDQITVAAQGELIEDPPTILLRAFGQTPASIMPTTVDQEIVFSDNVFKLPSNAEEKFSISTTFTSVSSREDRYLPRRKALVQEFATTNVTAGAPRIERLLPVQGEIYRYVTIKGSGFATDAARNEVTFSAYGGERVNAPVVSKTNDELVVAVPREAVSGPVRVTVDGNTGKDFSFFVRFHPEGALLFESLVADNPVAPRLIHQQPVDEGETINEVPLLSFTTSLNSGQLNLTGVTNEQQAGVNIVRNFYTLRYFTNYIVYTGRETNDLQRHVFEVRSNPTSSFVISRIHAHEPTNGGVIFTITSGAFPFNPGVVNDYRFSLPIYRPPATPGVNLALRLEMLSRQWASPPGTEMRVIENSTWRVQ